jgi:hypothetical protein
MKNPFRSESKAEPPRIAIIPAMIRFELETGLICGKFGAAGKKILEPVHDVTAFEYL